MKASICGGILGLLAWTVAGSGTRSGDLAPAPGQVRETYPGIRVEYRTLHATDGTRLRTIVTVPQHATGRLPAILFVHWLSCDTVALPPSGGGGWPSMIRRIVRESGAIVWRTEKRGVGDSEGHCDTLDYDTELADHRAALAALRQRADVDPDRIIIFGASIGATYAPLIAANEQVAGVMIWGGGALTWFERMLAFERNALELGNNSAITIAREMTLRARFFSRYLIDGETPQQITKSDPELGAVWSRIIGTGPESHYGRPFVFDQQAQAKNWAGAWSQVSAPVLVLRGEYDWFETVAGAESVVRAVRSSGNPQTTLHIVPGLDHHFTKYKSARDAYLETRGESHPDEAVGLMLDWLHARGIQSPTGH